MAGESRTYTQEEVDTLVAERLDKEVAGLKANQQEALRELKAARAKLSNYDGVDPDEFKRLKGIVDEAERKKATAEGDFKSLEKQLIDRHAVELSGANTKISKLTKALEQRLVDAQLASSLAKHEVDPTMLPLLQLEGRRWVRVREGEEDFEAFVADERGNPLILDGKGTPMSIDDLVSQRLKSQYPVAFRGTGSSGGGASKSTGGASGGGTVTDGQSFLRNLDKIASGEMTVPVTQ